MAIDRGDSRVAAWLDPFSKLLFENDKIKVNDIKNSTKVSQDLDRFHLRNSFAVNYRD